MGDKTSIQWTDATWNPTTGCSKVSAGCKHCYAERIFPRAYGSKFVRGDGKALIDADPPTTSIRPRRFTDVICHEDRLEQPLHWKKPRRIFVNSMSDLFHEDVPLEFIDKVFGAMALCQGDWGWFRFGRDYAAEGDPLNPRHQFQILTKRPERMREYLQMPERFQRIIERTCDFVHLQDFDYDWTWPLPNVWLGVSVEDQKTADERIPLLLQTPAAVRFVSYEPALGPVDFTNFLWATPQGEIVPQGGREPRLQWLIVGGESGPGARPFNLTWARSVIQQCAAARVSCFVKQLGAKPFLHAEYNHHEERPGFRMRIQQLEIDETIRLKDRKGGDIEEFPPDLRVREFPKVRV